MYIYTYDDNGSLVVDLEHLSQHVMELIDRACEVTENLK